MRACVCVCACVRACVRARDRVSVMLPNLSTLIVTPGNVFVRCATCASTFVRTSPIGCANCGKGPNPKRAKTEKVTGDDCGCKSKEGEEGKGASCSCDEDDEMPPPFHVLVADEADEDTKPVFRSLSGPPGPPPRLGMPTPEEQAEANRTRGYMMSLQEMEERDEQPVFRSLPASGDEPDTFQSMTAG